MKRALPLLSTLLLGSAPAFGALPAGVRSTIAAGQRHPVLGVELRTEAWAPRDTGGSGPLLAARIRLFPVRWLAVQGGLDRWSREDASTTGGASCYQRDSRDIAYGGEVLILGGVSERVVVYGGAGLLQHAWRRRGHAIECEAPLVTLEDRGRGFELLYGFEGCLSTHVHLTGGLRYRTGSIAQFAGTGERFRFDGLGVGLGLIVFQLAR